MSFARKRDSDAVSDNVDEGSVDPSDRASKKAKVSAFTSAKVISNPSSSTLDKAHSSRHTDDEGNPYWTLNGSGSRRIGVSTFKGMVMVGAREFYEKDGVWLPGKKGISLPVEQFAALIAALPQVEQALAENGATVPRPDYDGVVRDGAEDAAPTGELNEVEDGSRKKNHEATSDEDEG